MNELAPKAHMIHSIISDHWSVHSALAELVDNAFAPGKGGADAIWIDVQRDRICVDGVRRAAVPGVENAYVEPEIRIERLDLDALLQIRKRFAVSTCPQRLDGEIRVEQRLRVAVSH